MSKAFLEGARAKSQEPVKKVIAPQNCSIKKENLEAKAIKHNVFLESFYVFIVAK